MTTVSGQNPAIGPKNNLTPATRREEMIGQILSRMRERESSPPPARAQAEPAPKPSGFGKGRYLDVYV
jgi:hypothetical protein